MASLINKLLYMKSIFYVMLVLCSTFCSAQKYILVDKKMSLPVTYANTLSVQDNYHGYFPIEKSKIKEFLAEVEKIAKLLGDPKGKKPEKFHYLVGSTIFHGIRVALSTEERLDVVLTTNYGPAVSTLHLCDAKISNANNVFYINTWLKYLHSYID